MSLTPAQMLRTPIFWLMFLMMAMMSTSGLMVVSQMGAFTRDFGLANLIVFGLPVLPLALSVDRITNGLTRPFFGWVSDRIGRENTMVIAFALEGVAMTAWLLTRESPVLFVLLSGVVVLWLGVTFSSPSTLTDTYGPKHATTNYGLLVHGSRGRLRFRRTPGGDPSRADAVLDSGLPGDHRDGLLSPPFSRCWMLEPMRRRWLARTVVAEREEIDGAAPGAIPSTP